MPDCMGIGEIMKILPHRYPFLLVDAVEEREPGVRCLARKSVTVNEPFFPGHYPGRPIMPGVLIVEALAQTSGLALVSEETQGLIPLFTGIEKAKFRRQVVPGDVLKLEVEVLQFKRNMGKVKGTAKVGGELACEAELSFFLAKAE